MTEIQSTFSYLAKNTTDWHHLGISDEFVDHGKIPSLRKQFLLDKDGIYNYIKTTILEFIQT